MTTLPKSLFQRQQGFALLELAIALAISTMLVVWGANKMIQDVEDQANRSTGAWLVEIKKAVDQMMAHHFDLLAAGKIPVNSSGEALYADPFAPEINELKVNGHLSSNFPSRSPIGLEVSIRIRRSVDCPGAGCRLDALTYTHKPLHDPRTSEPDLMRIAGVIMATDGYGGAVYASNPNFIQGVNFKFDNPFVLGQTPLPVGTLAIWSNLDPAYFNRFVRMQDERNPDLQGDLSVAGAMRTEGPLTAAKNMAVNGRLTANEYFKIEGQARPGESCDENGLMAREETGQFLSCTNGTWASSGGGDFGGAYATNNKFGCSVWGNRDTRNPKTGACSCPAGYQAVLISSGGKWTEDEGWTEGYICVK